MNDIIRILSGYISDEILQQPERDVSQAEPLISSGLIDSFHLVDLALFVEDKFGVRIDDSELNSTTFDSVAALADIIRQRQ